MARIGSSCDVAVQQTSHVGGGHKLSVTSYRLRWTMQRFVELPVAFAIASEDTVWGRGGRDVSPAAYLSMDREVGVEGADHTPALHQKPESWL